MLKKRTVPYSYISTCICCFLVSAGLCILVNTGFETELSYTEIMLQAVVTSMLLGITVYNGKTAVFGGGLAAVGIFILTLIFNIKNVNDFTSFLEWCFAQTPEDSVWYSQENLELLHICINIGICILIFLAARTPWRSRITVLSALAIICLVYFLYFIQFNRIVLIFVFTGVFSLCATDKFEHRKHFTDKKSFVALGKHWLVPAAALLLCTAIASTTLICLDNDKVYNTRNRVCSDIAVDIQSLTGVYTKQQKKLSLSLYDLGLQKSKKHIGGDLPKIEHNILAVTDLNHSYNVKVTTFDTFTGKNWHTEFEDCYRVNGPFADKEKQCLANSVLYDFSLIKSLKTFLFLKKVRFTITIDSYFLPTVGQTYRYTENSKTINPTLFNGNGQLFSYFGQEKGYTYTLDTVQFDTTSELTPEENAALNMLSSVNDPAYTQEFIAKYTKTTVNFSENFKNQIDSMKLNTTNNFEIAYKVNNYFTKERGFSYSSEGLDFNTDSNIISELFLKRTGHCLYYSTAAIAILRYLKIPSRLAVGYRTLPLSKNIQVIDSANPYCWVECYFPNLGWIGFDPSPEHKIDYAFEIPSFSKKPNSHKDKTGSSFFEKLNFKLFGKGNVPFKLLFLIPTLMLVYLLSRGFWASRIYSLSCVRRRFGSRKKQCEFYISDIMRQFTALGFKLNATQTYREQMLAVCTVLDADGKDILLDTLETCEAICYGSHSLNDMQVEKLYTARKMLEAALQHKLNPFVYLFKRKVFIPIISRHIKMR